MTSIITTGLSELRSDTRITLTKNVRDVPYPLELSARLGGCPPRARVRQFSLVPLRHFCRLSSPRPFKRCTVARTPLAGLTTCFLMPGPSGVCSRGPFPCRPILLCFSKSGRGEHFSSRRLVACRTSEITHMRLPQSVLDWLSSTWTIRSLASCSGGWQPPHGLCIG